MPAWFEAYSLADPTARQDLQQPGLRASVQHIRAIVEQEAQRLQTENGHAGAQSQLVLGGISLGGAVALWTLLGTAQPEQPLGGFIAASTWLPCSRETGACLGCADTDVEGADDAAPETDNDMFVHSRMAPLQQHIRRRRVLGTVGQGSSSTAPVRTTPVFLRHRWDDAYVDVELGRQVQRLLAGVGFTSVEWHEHESAEQEGHWLKAPEEMDDIARFLAAVESRAAMPSGPSGMGQA